MLNARLLEIAERLYVEAPPLDRLPYTPQFDAIHAEFCGLSGRDLTLNEVWLYLLSVRNRGQAALRRPRLRAARS